MYIHTYIYIHRSKPAISSLDQSVNRHFPVDKVPDSQVLLEQWHSGSELFRCLISSRGRRPGGAQGAGKMGRPKMWDLFSLSMSKHVYY